ncbi:MAG: HAD-IIB family hydrolase [Methanosarcinaceae archaeon]|nr:HAD-IIB family hydrolase [Methanosarcinaceae archaeon]
MTHANRMLICTDLDRTLLPNGPQAESHGAREAFKMLVGHDGARLAFVTGRHRALVEQAIDEYDLPLPDFVIADVGASIYSVRDKEWFLWREWQQKLAGDWRQHQAGDLRQLLADLGELTPQEEEKQGIFKLSYYTSVDPHTEDPVIQINRRLSDAAIKVHVIQSIDETRNIGLIDILPAGASKLHAISFLASRTGYVMDDCFFAGDSGNDLAVLTSPMQAILVANATARVRAQAVRLSEEQGTRDSLYLAQGGYRGMNGCYSAGILEGLVYFRPKLDAWIP